MIKDINQQRRITKQHVSISHIGMEQDELSDVNITDGEDFVSISHIGMEPKNVGH